MTAEAAVVVLVALGLVSWCSWHWGRTTGQTRPSLAEIRQAAVDLADYYEVAAAHEQRLTRRPTAQSGAWLGQAGVARSLVEFMDGDTAYVDKARRRHAHLLAERHLPHDPGGR